MSKLTKGLLIVFGFGVLLFILTRLGVFSGKRPDEVGEPKEKLAPCPDSPNCVSTWATDAEHGIAPIPYTTSRAEAQAKMRAVVENLPLTRVIVDEPGYLYVEFRTAVMMFTDDVEFVFDDDAKQVHFRSASRLGYSDMGLNRRRMEQIRQIFTEN